MTDIKNKFIVTLTILLICCLFFIGFERNKINHLNADLALAKDISRIEEKNKEIESNKKQIEILINEKNASSKKIADLEKKLTSLRKKKPRKEDITNEIKNYSVDDISNFLNKWGYDNKVLRGDGNIYKYKHSP